MLRNSNTFYTKNDHTKTDLLKTAITTHSVSNQSNKFQQVLDLIIRKLLITQ
jgi:hypothetical protein